MHLLLRKIATACLTAFLLYKSIFLCNIPYHIRIKKDRESNGESNVWCKTDGEKKENRGPDGDVRIERNSGSGGKGEWNEMVRACVEEGWWAYSEKSVGVWSEGQEEAWTTKEDVEKESKTVGLEKKDAMNRARWRVGVREIAAGVNPATPVYRDKPRSKLVSWFWWWFVLDSMHDFQVLCEPRLPQEVQPPQPYMSHGSNHFEELEVWGKIPDDFATKTDAC